MRNILNTSVGVLLAGALAVALIPVAGTGNGKLPAVGIHKGKHTDLNEILAQMNAESKILRTVSADLDYTTVTVLVDDKSTQTGHVFFRKAKIPEICVKFQTPAPEVLLLKQDKGYFYLQKINQVQEYNVGDKSAMVQQFLLLGFGSDTAALKKIYDIKYLQETPLGQETTVQLELTPRKGSVPAQIAKIQLWVSEDSWLPVQQQISETSRDYHIAHYSNVQKNPPLPDSDFELNAPSNAKIVKMN